MEKIPEQLMEEIKQVNELNTRVDAVVAQRKAEKMAERKKTAEHIGKFLESMKQYLIEAHADAMLHIDMPFFCGRCRIYLQFCSRYQYGEFFRRGDGDIWKDGHASLYYFPLSIIPQQIEHGGVKVWEAVCDNWSDEAELLIGQAVAEEVKRTLAKRVAEMTAQLKEED